MILSGFSHVGARWLASIAVAVLILVASWHSALAADDSPVAATVNGETITRTEILLALELLPAQFRNLPPDQLFPLIRNQLIDIKLLSAKGAESGLKKDPRISARVDFYAMRLAHDYYARDIVGKYLDEDLLQEGYQKFLENFPKAEETNISHILVATEAEAQEVVAELKSGADFSATARRYSVGPSAPQGGALGFLRREQVVPEFAEAAFALEDGGISEPVKTSFGWHVITASERRIPEPPEFSQVEQKLRAEIADRLVSDAAKQERQEAEIELFEMDEDFFDGETVAP
ncbi:MAG: peptidylprolyl isomerase [Proteobacteria bacterium]|nr:peptidylprolyl isomerase [Pseudomonadota bacterium]MDA1356674.1 peptidylprolyl isomerase [Pseudomonadota bacterium]